MNGLMDDWVGIGDFIEQKSAYEMRIGDWSSDGCSTDLRDTRGDVPAGPLNSFSEVLDSPAVMDNPIFDQMREGVMRRLQRFGMAGQSGLLRNDAVATVSQAEELRKLIGGLGASNDPTVRAGRRMMIDALDDDVVNTLGRSEEHTSELQSLMRIS